MASEFEFLSPTDKPALLAINNPEWLALCRTVLNELDFKVHAIEDHAEFSSRFTEVQYQAVIIDEAFSGSVPGENPTFHLIQRMPMNQRRHAAFVLLSETGETLNAMQAFQQSVHAVVNYSQIALLGQILPKVVADNNLFFNTFREAQLRIAQTRA